MKEAEILKQGGVGVIPTDTLYGIVACALNECSVECVYTLKGRTPTKPSIVLISSSEDINLLFGIALSEKRHELVSKYWPGPVSIVLHCGDNVPEYLHRGTGTLAFRVPNYPELRTFLLESGPLIAPSANPEGLPPATTVEEAREYFGDTVDFYIDGGKRAGMPSTLIAFDEHDSVIVLRDGTQTVQPI
ncbi:MAG: L-threonylcarbamoyladenylate synthase [Candidatus Paceibacterota bacterium]|jgi:L-threonylcarbamoyladenylate synthase